ncbi:putative acetyl-CoA carboxylase [Helianthus debilis subsp. tardiflorus]
MLEGVINYTRKFYRYGYTSGVTTSFRMLEDIIIAETNAYIAFTDKRVIEQTLNKTVAIDSQAAEHLF